MNIGTIIEEFQEYVGDICLKKCQLKFQCTGVVEDQGCDGYQWEDTMRNITQGDSSYPGFM